jgi:hypothetical protein
MPLGALAEHITAHPEDAGLTPALKNFEARKQGRDLHFLPARPDALRRRGGEPANSTICSAVKPCANRTASLQPSCVHEASSFDRAPLCWAREPTSGRGAPA